MAEKEGEMANPAPMRLMTYEQVVERYELDILKEPGDLVLKDGDIALTKGGLDLMLNSPEYHAMFRRVQAWRYNAPTLQSLFDLVFSIKLLREALDNQMRTTALAPIANYHQLNDEIRARESAYFVYAGSVVLALNGMLAACKDDMDATDDDWDACPPLIHGCSVGAILRASANNFRHNDEWAKTRSPKPNQLTSIRVLSTAFREPIMPDGSDHRFSRDICPETLELLGSSSFDTLSSHVFTFAHNMAKRQQLYRGRGQGPKRRPVHPA